MDDYLNNLITVGIELKVKDKNLKNKIYSDNFLGQFMRKDAKIEPKNDINQRNQEKSQILYNEKEESLININENTSNVIEDSINYINNFSSKKTILQDSTQKKEKIDDFNISNTNIINTEDIEKDEERLEKINGKEEKKGNNNGITDNNEVNQENIEYKNIIDYKSLELENNRTLAEDSKNLDYIKISNEKELNKFNLHTKTNKIMFINNNNKNINSNGIKKQSININNNINYNINSNTNKQINMKIILSKAKTLNSKKFKLNTYLSKNKKFPINKNSKHVNNPQILENIGNPLCTKIKKFIISEQNQNNNKNLIINNIPEYESNSELDRILERNSKSFDKTFVLKKNYFFQNNKFVNNLVPPKHILNKNVNIFLDFKGKKIGKSNYLFNKQDFKTNIEKRIKDNKSSCEIIPNNIKLIVKNNSNNNLFHVDNNLNLVETKRDKFRSCNKVPNVKKYIKYNDNVSNSNILTAQVQNDDVDGDEKKKIDKIKSRTFLNLAKSTSLDKIRIKFGNIENSQNFFQHAYYQIFNTSINYDLNSKSRTNKFLNIQTNKNLLNNNNNYNKNNHSHINNINIYSKYNRKYDLYSNNIFIRKNSDFCKNKGYSNIKPRYMQKAPIRNKTVDILAMSVPKKTYKKSQVELDCRSNKTNGIKSKDTIRDNTRKKSIQSINSSMNYCYNSNFKVNEKYSNLNFLKEIDNKINIKIHSPEKVEDERKYNQLILNTESINNFNYNTLPNEFNSINGVYISNTEENDYETRKKIISDKFCDQNKLLENFDKILKGLDKEKTVFENETNKTLNSNNKYYNLSNNNEETFDAIGNLAVINHLNQSTKIENIDFNNFLKYQFFEIPNKDSMNINNFKDKINGKDFEIINESKIIDNSNPNNKNQNDLTSQLNTTNNLNSNNIVKNKYKNLIDNFFN